MPYETAYIGIAPAPNGDFDHFVRQLRTLHLTGGYWRFQSIEDDRRANARGFTTPEDVLCAAEFTDEGFDEIFIRWVRGADDPNISMALSGTPSQHLQTIYELRLLLGLPVSSRGQIPQYPISTELRVKQFWEAKYRAQQSPLINTAGQLPGKPISSPVTPRPGTLKVSQPRPFAPAAPKSPVGRITRARSKKTSQEARPTPAVRATPSQQAPDAPIAHATWPSLVRPLSRVATLPSLTTNKTDEQQSPLPITASPTSMSVPPASSATRDVPFIPRAALAWGLQSSTLPTLSSLSLGISQHDWVHSSSRNSNVGYSSSSATPQQQYEANGAMQPQQDAAATASLNATASLDIPYQSPYAASGTQLGHTNPVVTPSAPIENAGDIRAPTSPPRKSYEATLDSMSRSVLAPLDSPPARIEVVPIRESFSTDGNSLETPDKLALARGKGVEWFDDSRPQQELERLNIQLPDADNTKQRARAQAIKAMSEPLRTYMEGLENLPCMDCGEEDNHLWDCHLGNIQPLQDLTALDYRTLTDAVEMFDPGPWTTHFDLHPEPEPEDAETQIKGMAEVIRNEDSYKMDDELHNLPDEFMIILWAFKTSGKVQVINECNWDSGTSQSETEGGTGVLRVQGI
ncbi:hypothetical protein G6011_00973 [Alternaria panax]|uniref:Uncharacterized protein n=1 Tax=Alternaria panax TaxID=48097 RepID=A0AAD4IJ36_9PLEO|nr:hypothetical protein G6011_00973 [Alternaria panax]